MVSINGDTQWMVCKESPNLKWMMTGGSPILGNPHRLLYCEPPKNGGIESSKFRDIMATAPNVGTVRIHALAPTGIQRMSKGRPRIDDGKDLHISL